jgi:hypothetical protein
MGIEDKVADEVEHLLPQIYSDIAQPAAKEIGIVLGRSVKVLLTPLRGFLWSWESIEKTIIEGIEKRLKSRPEENWKTPDPEIAVPLIQTLSYTAQNETLREMYLNLLANSMDKSQEKNVHPSFVEIIRQMDSLDAKLFKVISKSRGYIDVMNPKIELVRREKWLVDTTPEWFIGISIDGYDIFDISASIVRLCRQRIIELVRDRTAEIERIQELKKDPLIVSILEKSKIEYPIDQVELRTTSNVIYVTEFGKQFAKSCF